MYTDYLSTQINQCKEFERNMLLYTASLLELGCIAMVQGKNLSFSHGQYTSAFEAEVYAIKACAVENLDRNYKNRNIYIVTGSRYSDCHRYPEARNTVPLLRNVGVEQRIDPLLCNVQA
jgi:hypothetical protein